MAQKAVQGKIQVTSHFHGEEVESSEEYLEVQTFDSEPAHFSGKLGMTIATAPYESARADVMVTLPAYPEEVDKAFERIWELAERELNKITKGIKNGKQIQWKPI